MLCPTMYVSVSMHALSNYVQIQCTPSTRACSLNGHIRHENAVKYDSSEFKTFSSELANTALKEQDFKKW